MVTALLRQLFILFALSLSTFTPSFAAEVSYELTLSKKLVNYSGEQAVAMVINGSLPGPVLRFTEGDEAVITVHNQMDTDASIHWHGLLLPQAQDGVPYVTMMPIKPYSSYTYRFPIRHAGTYWYHSHTNIDEQRGQYGAIVIQPKQPRAFAEDYDQVIQFSDWTDEDPLQVLANLKKNGHWYAQKKDSVVSIGGYISRGETQAWLSNRKQRMEGMDVSDVGYDAFLANGERQLTLLSTANAGDRVKLRLINSAASSYFNVVLSEQTPMTVIAADGLDVEPVSVYELNMGMAETYDVLVTIPESGALTLHANNIDGTGFAEVLLGSGTAAAAPLPERPNLYMAMNHSDHAGHGEHDSGYQHHGAHQHHGHHHSSQRPVHQEHLMHGDTVIKLSPKGDALIHPRLHYALLKSTKAVRYAGELNVIKLDITGNMDSYTWSFNNQTMTMAEVISISRGQRVQFEFNNTTMMHHPLHLHGHFFKVLSGNGDYDVLKHTVDVAPMAKVTIEFYADAEKDWLFHCHNLYHAKSGMARMVRYDDYHGNHHYMEAKKRSDELTDDRWFWRHDAHLMSEFVGFNSRLSNIHYVAAFDLEYGAWRDVRLESHIAKIINQNSRVFIGAEYEEFDNAATDGHMLLGFGYNLPYDVEAEIAFNDHGELHVGVETDLQLSKHWLLTVEADTESAWNVALDYVFSPTFSTGLYASDIAPVSVGVHWTF